MKILICVSVPALFVILGIRIYFSKSPVQYMANATELPIVSDVKSYNHALGRNFWLFALLLFFILLPVMLNDSIAGGIITVLCMPFWAIGFMLRCMRTETKYSKK